MSATWIRLALAGGLTAAVVVACTVSLPDDGKYKCATDADCGANYICFQGSYCCQRDGDVCVGSAGGGSGGGNPGNEICNNADDDGDGQVDEGYDLQTDRNHCGQCNNQCTAAQTCTGGNCVGSGESSCTDGVDNDSDSLTDCADSDCNNQSCGTGCACRNGGKHETVCTGNTDEDGDSLTDCADPDCDIQLCGQGCRCFAGGKSEVGCDDGVDNDGDALIDCQDAQADGGGDCPTGRRCKTGANTSTCSAGLCLCNGSPAPASETKCGDGIDNDCSGTTDCSDTNCNTLSCQTDGGPPSGGALCVCGNNLRRENATAGACANRIDDDGDAFVDCADTADCPQGTQCRKPNGQLGTCNSSGGCN